jgi:Rrf2 family protein
MFCLSQTTGYAILALSCLGGPGGQPTLVRDIARYTGISKPYLSKIMHALAAKGLVETKRGYKGGVALARPPEQITLLDVAEAVEGNQWMCRCMLGLAECSEDRACPVHAFWKPLQEKIGNQLRELTLAQVAEFESHHILRSACRVTGRSAMAPDLRHS